MFLRDFSVLALACSATGCFSDAEPTDGATNASTSSSGDTDSAGPTEGSTSTSAGQGTDGATSTSTSSGTETATNASSATGDTDGATDTGSGSETTGGVSEKHLVFVTSEVYRGDLQGLAGADAKCVFLAEQAGLRAEAWVAVLSDAATDVTTRVKIDHPVVNTLGEVIVSTSKEFWDEELYAPLLDEYGDLPPKWDPVDNWAVTWAARYRSTCQSWTNDTLASIGYGGVTQAGYWIYGGGKDWGCNNEWPFLCISQ